jgi:hypothetical protein
VAAGRTLHVRCATWEQVEAFHTRKLRRGKLLSMKVPFQAQNGAQVTLGLELPNGVVIAIDGNVLKASPIEGDTKTWIEVELTGFTDEVTQRIRALAKSAEQVKPQPAPPPPPPVKPRVSTRDVEEKPSDERAMFQQLTAELKRLRAQPVHEVLGVSRDADAEAVRVQWMNLVRKHHPDLVARHNAPAITHLAEELTILLNRAYDRLRVALVAEGRATTIGSTLQHPSGWLVGFEDLSSVDGTPVKPRTATSARVATPPQGVPTPPRTTTTQAPAPNVQGGEAFEQRARAMLLQGDANNAQEVLAAALVVYPRSKPLRSLYYVASAVAAMYKGEMMLATSQLETALAHHAECKEAAAILDEIRKRGDVRPDEIKSVFA